MFILTEGVNTVSESEYIKRCQEGDSEAFGELLTLYENKILNYCYRMLGNRTDAEDATQEVFVKLYRFIGSFTGQSAFSTWLYKIASNVCLDYLRKNKKHTSDTVSLHQQNAEGEEFLMNIEDKGLTPYESAQMSEAQRVLALALEQLSEDQRKVVVLRDVEGLSYEEIGEVMGIAEGTVKSRINRARLALKKLLEKDRELFSLS
ncbi:MAG: sigma-70 family RNA polymerase sigma factor [Ruminococcaceae bacterium]|nr:sigma-70 family RNA polymerase sigma factor [Oscillospiraceae bacterium]